jgi:peptidoglycan hydrolase-like protein with peptidoglycan-binding domain
VSRRVVVAVVAAGVLGATAGAFVLLRDDPAPAKASPAGSTTTARVERTDLVDRESVPGTLGFAEQGALAIGVSGTLTRLRPEGLVVRRGGWLAEVDGKRTGWLLYGRRPAWRDFRPGMTDGADVRQLEANLAAMGHAPGTVDEDWTSSTTAAVKRFQDARGLTEDGALERGELVFRSGAVRVGEHKATAGRPVGPGVELASVASTQREVSVDLDADRQALARAGRGVTVELPSGRVVDGRIAEVASVAKSAGRDQPATVAVRVSLRVHGGRLDQAPVDVGFERERAKDALTVPVTALLATAGRGYAVEVPGRGLVPVQPSLFADGRVAVEGDLRVGERVVVPA